jgi:hypothetical protein
MSTELDDATISEWLARSRASQGLPATITDGSVLAKIVTLALTKSPAPAAEQNGARPASSSR